MVIIFLTIAADVSKTSIIVPVITTLCVLVASVVTLYLLTVKLATFLPYKIARNILIIFVLVVLQAISFHMMLKNAIPQFKTVLRNKTTTV